MADSVRDWSRWAVPIMVAVIAAVGSIAAAVAVPLLLRDDHTGESPATPAGTPAARSSPDPAAGRPGPTPTGPAVWISSFGVETGTMGGSTDLDGNLQGERGDQITDLVFSENAISVSGGARLALLGTGEAPRPDVCTAALDRTPVDAVPGPDLQPGTVICYRTSAGRTGHLTVTQLTDSIRDGIRRIQVIAFEYVTWDG